MDEPYLGVDEPHATDAAASSGEGDAATRGGLRLTLWVQDPEVVRALARFSAPRERNDFALSALRLGVLALDRASGEIDAAHVRHEGERLVASLQTAMVEHTQRMTQDLAGALREYLDPAGGKLTQRLQALVAHDGELGTMLRSHVGSGDSEIARTLARHLGHESPLLRVLDPEHQSGVLAKMAALVEHAITQQREQVLAQFTLDSKDSALARLIAELTDQQGKLRAEFTEDLGKLVAEFSLDNDTSALSRLVQQVDQARRGIVEQFSLDAEGSALSRLRRELGEVLGKLGEQQRVFQDEVKSTLATLQSRRATEARSTLHGIEFEARVGAVLREEADRTGDTFEAVGTTTGQVLRSKVGDFVLELGAEHQGAGRRIVIEAKEAQSYTDRKALEELAEARKNRGADVGVFVFSRQIAGPETPPLRRFGPDLLVVWDAEDPVQEVYLRAAVSIGRALLHDHGRRSPAADLDLDAVARAVNEIEKMRARVAELKRLGSTIGSSAGKIEDEAASIDKTLARQIDKLRAHLDEVRALLPGLAPT